MFEKMPVASLEPQTLMFDKMMPVASLEPWDVRNVKTHFYTILELIKRHNTYLKTDRFRNNSGE